MVTPDVITTAVARWCEEAKSLPPAKARKSLTAKALWVSEQFNRQAGPAWSLSLARDTLLTEAKKYAR